VARPSLTQPLVPSILDRLIDVEPGKVVEGYGSRTQMLKELRESVRRDLQNLLNTRAPSRTLPGHGAILSYSIINYGIPDFAGADLSSSEDKEQFRTMIEAVIKRYETRFKSVHVTIIEGDGETDRALRFRIDALLNVEPAVKPVVFDSSLEPVTRTIEVKDVSNG
jgi:type VI secretion system protein ImpF